MDGGVAGLGLRVLDNAAGGVNIPAPVALRMPCNRELIKVHLSSLNDVLLAGSAAHDSRGKIAEPLRTLNIVLDEGFGSGVESKANPSLRSVNTRGYRNPVAFYVFE